MMNFFFIEMDVKPQMVQLEQRDLVVRRKKNSISVYHKDRTKSSHTQPASHERNSINISGNSSVSSGRGQELDQEDQLIHLQMMKYYIYVQN